ncbi:MAG: hypothetical protein ABIQ86_09610 [Steroidobacteraceae bacterium]
MNVLRLMAIGGVLLGIGAVLDSKCAGRNRKERTEDQLDDALDGTFPASDPTATQDFAIPVNRA